MGATASTTEEDKVPCIVCKEVCTSPRFLPCHHCLCLKCLEILGKIHDDFIPCPVCKCPAKVPPGGVSNFPATSSPMGEDCTMCPVHDKERVILHCKQCDQLLCIVCKVTKHEGHVTEALSEAAGRCKEKTEKELRRVDGWIRSLEKMSAVFGEKESRVREKRDAVTEKIQFRYEAVVAMATKYRDEALKELQDMSDRAEKVLAERAQPVQNELNSLLQLRERGRRALSTDCDAVVVLVDKELTRKARPGVYQWASELDKTRYLDTADPFGLHSDATHDLSNDVSSDAEKYVKSYLLAPVKRNS